MPRNILILKPGAIGDLLHLTPVLRGLRATYPEAKITVLVGSSGSEELFRHNPNVDATIVYDRRGEHGTLRGFWGLRRRLSESRYDLVINFQRSNLKLWFLATAAFPCRVLVYHKMRTRVIHAVEDHLRTVAPLGISPTGKELDLYLSDEDREYATVLFESHGMDKRPVIALNPGASQPVKCWSTAQFAALADRVSSELGAAVIVVGGNGDTHLANDIDRLSRSHPLILTGTTNLLQLGAVLEKASLLVSGDTGPLHVATAVRTPVIALFGAIDPARTGPVGSGHVVLQARDVACLPCCSKECGNARYLECMEKITVDEVYQAVVELLNRNVAMT